MPAPVTTDKYPLWIKQALHALLDNPERMPFHIPFSSKDELSQFTRMYYGYQKALAKEEEQMHLQHMRSPDKFPPATDFAKQLGSLILRTPADDERKYPTAFAERVINFRDDDPRTMGVQSIFQELIEETNAKAFDELDTTLTHPEDAPFHAVNPAPQSMEDMLGTLGYNKGDNDDTNS